MVQTRSRKRAQTDDSQEGTLGSNDQSDQPAHLVDDAGGEESRKEVSKREREVTPSRGTIQKRVKKAHGELNGGSAESSDYLSTPLRSLVDSFEWSRDSQTQHHILWQVLENVSVVSPNQPLTFLGYYSDTEASQARATTISLYRIVKLHGDTYVEPVKEIAVMLGVPPSELESHEEMAPLFDVPVDPRLQQLYENSTPLIQDLWEDRDNEKTKKGLDEQNCIINEQWGFQCAIQYATLLEYRAKAQDLARDVSTSYDDDQARESLNQRACEINEQARNFLVENRYPARWQALLAIEGPDLWLSYPVQDGSSAYRSKRRISYPDKEPCLKQQDEIGTALYMERSDTTFVGSCTPLGKAQTRIAPGDAQNDIAVKAYSKITYEVKSKVFQKMVFIVQPHLNTKIYEIRSGTRMGHLFMQMFLSSPSTRTLQCLDKRTSLDLSQLQSRYLGVRAVACSSESDRVEVEAVFRNNSGQGEPETIWLNRLRMHNLLGATRADVEIREVFEEGKKTPPWIKTKERKTGRPRRAVGGSLDLNKEVLLLKKIVAQHEAELQRICSEINGKFGVPDATTTKEGKRPKKLTLKLGPKRGV